MASLSITTKTQSEKINNLALVDIKQLLAKSAALLPTNRKGPYVALYAFSSIIISLNHYSVYWLLKFLNSISNNDFFRFNGECNLFLYKPVPFTTFILVGILY